TSFPLLLRNRQCSARSLKWLRRLLLLRCPQNQFASPARDPFAARPRHRRSTGLQVALLPRPSTDLDYCMHHSLLRNLVSTMSTISLTRLSPTFPDVFSPER